MRPFSLMIFMLVSVWVQAQQTGTVKVGLMKYKGGGDWYANPTALPNLAKFCNEKLGTNFIENEYETVEVANADIFNYPFEKMYVYISSN